MLVCVYPDRPGVTANIAGHLAAAQINIEDMRNPHDLNTNRSLAIVRVNKAVPEDVVKALGKDIAAHSALFIQL
jgi:hypothetical protein